MGLALGCGGQLIRVDVQPCWEGQVVIVIVVVLVPFDPLNVCCDGLLEVVAFRANIPVWKEIVVWICALSALVKS